MSATNTVFYPRASDVATGSLAVSNASITPPAPTNIVGLVFFDVQNADVMVTLDGTTVPSPTVGHRLASGTNYTWYAQTWAKAKFIRQGGTDARIAYTEFAC